MSRFHCFIFPSKYNHLFRLFPFYVTVCLAVVICLFIGNFLFSSRHVGDKNKRMVVRYPLMQEKEDFEEPTPEPKKVINCPKEIYERVPSRSKTNIPDNFLRLTDKEIEIPRCGFGDLLKPWFYPQEERYDMLLFVKVAPVYFHERQRIRTSYGKVRSLRKMKFATIFVIARPRTNEQQFLLESENKLYGDLLQCDFLDSYDDLPIKVTSTLGWIMEDHLDATFYTFTDDDCVANLARLHKYFTTHHDEDTVFCGAWLEEEGEPLRGVISKWSITEEMYYNTHFPNFCHGPMYTMQKKLIHRLHCMSRRTERGDFFLEDVYVTGILREKLGFGRTKVEPVRILPEDKLTQEELEDPNKGLLNVTECIHKAHSPNVTRDLNGIWDGYNLELFWNEYQSAKEKHKVMTFYERTIDQHYVDQLITKWENY